MWNLLFEVQTMNKNSKLAKSQNKKRKNVNNNNNNEGPLSKKQKVEHTVHEGTVEYAHNVMNPFVRTNTRIPHAPMVSSQKVSAIVKGTAITNANGQTFISVAPIRAAAFDGNSVIVSDTAYAGTVFPSYGTANTTFFNSNSPYNLADLTYNNSQTFAARIVSTGLRTRYIGTELNKGGRVFSIDSEGHFPLDGRSLSEISEDPVSHEDTLNNEWPLFVDTQCIHKTLIIRSTILELLGSILLEILILQIKITLLGL